ncbi:MAG: hypothetical protein CLLPBCKN_008484 [Chroococcidiopsis cubana SAG 39.79]|jgi:hypothetical protein|uniref:Uncharacterized protein n=1 Tax=Chroococcidiopsis cubana SAG 39.79 TaxID=388085 RepID=A0AB37U8L3_9CYAN|nr:hypothetical protein [Chroococcidiopsis cubana]MBE9017642.1 hypothetical protein [Chroococcidiopsidales cyanobacterium LEGE 13417]MDZ4879046.1 hypothetical protein [Chroococcidiopsis cubana SAG 39.79]PSB60257.1 hypothetical protein C7B79_26425 [Chroococcidiopsis cubana CCALA 043]RUT00304.1 hypothetical protein DSM107010_68220 [Chroococcidiopsis cubana SAG 39.79]
MNTNRLSVGTKVVRTFVSGNKEGEILGITSKEKNISQVGLIMQVVYKIRFQDGTEGEYEEGDFGVIN